METIYPGRYRHYKGNYYEVIGEAAHSETMESLVVYRALYGAYGLWVRPKAMFLGTVVVGGRAVLRFEPVISIEVWRAEAGQNQEGYFQQFEVPSREPLSVMTLLAKVHELDAGFACRTSTCFKGKCGSCLVKVDGQETFGCVKLINPGAKVVIEPSAKFKLIRDVVVDFSQPLNTGEEVEQR